ALVVRLAGIGLPVPRRRDGGRRAGRILPAIGDRHPPGVVERDLLGRASGGHPELVGPALAVPVPFAAVGLKVPAGRCGAHGESLRSVVSMSLSVSCPVLSCPSAACPL